MRRQRPRKRKKRRAKKREHQVEKREAYVTVAGDDLDIEALYICYLVRLIHWPSSLLGRNQRGQSGRVASPLAFLCDT